MSETPFEQRRKLTGLSVEQQTKMEEFKRLVGMTSSPKLVATIANLELARREVARDRDDERARNDSLAEELANERQAHEGTLDQRDKALATLSHVLQMCDDAPVGAVWLSIEAVRATLAEEN